MAKTNQGMSVPNKSNLSKVSMSIDALPSQSKSYPEHSEIKYRTYSYGEVKQSSNSKESYEDVIRSVLSGVSCSFNKYDLTLFDMMYIGLSRRVSTLGTEKLRLPYTCPECGHKGEHVFKFTDVEFKDIGAKKIPVVVEIEDKVLHFSPITVQQFIDLIKMKKHKEPLAVLSKMVINHEFNEIYKFFSELTNSEDFELLDEIEKLLDHGLKPLEFHCTNKIPELDNKVCNYKMTVNIGGKHELLKPFREDRKPVKSRIQYLS